MQVSCWGQSVATLDAELFGAEKGAVEGATERRRGLLEIADRGTVFLQEVAELPIELQPKLLRVLETRSFRRVGGNREVEVDVRLIASTTHDLNVDVEAGRFREDLHYRLNVMPIELPPLRDRSREDRLTLLNRLLNDLQRHVSSGPPSIGPGGAGTDAGLSLARQRTRDAQRPRARA